MKIINGECLWLQHQADVLGVVTLRMAGCCAGSRRLESPGGPAPPTHALESSLHSSTLSEGHFERAFLKSEWGLAAAAPLSTLHSTGHVPKASPMLDPLHRGPEPSPCRPLSPQPPRGLPSWPRQGLSDRPDSPSRLSPVSHGNTIALFFRSLLPNYTVEVRGAQHVGAASLRPGVGSRGGGLGGGSSRQARLRRVSLPQGERPEDGGAGGPHLDQGLNRLMLALRDMMANFHFHDLEVPHEDHLEGDEWD